MKRFAVLGNCQANALAATLQVCLEFKSNFKLVRTTPIHRISLEDHRAFLAKVLPGLDLYLYQPISDQFRGGGFSSRESLEHVSSTSCIVSYPSMQFYGYHAGASVLPDLPSAAKERTRNLLGVSGSELFHFGSIVRSFLAGKAPDVAELDFHDASMSDAELIRRRTERSLAHLKDSEGRQCIDARVHDFIVENFRRRQVFWSPRHPSGDVLLHVAVTILGKLGITPSNEEVERMRRRDPLALPRYPMQRPVIDALGLEFSGPAEFRSKSVGLGLRDLIRSYYEIYEVVERQLLESLARSKFPIQSADSIA